MANFDEARLGVRAEHLLLAHLARGLERAAPAELEAPLVGARVRLEALLPLAPAAPPRRRPEAAETRVMGPKQNVLL